jgi:hypothetical protein
LRSGCSVSGGNRFAVGLVFFDLAVANAAFGEDLNKKEVVGTVLVKEIARRFEVLILKFEGRSGLSP